MRIITARLQRLSFLLLLLLSLNATLNGQQTTLARFGKRLRLPIAQTLKGTQIKLANTTTCQIYLATSIYEFHLLDQIQAYRQTREVCCLAACTSIEKCCIFSRT